MWYSLGTMKQILQIEQNNLLVKILNWPEAYLLAIYKHGLGVDIRVAEKQLQLEVKAGLELGAQIWCLQK